MKKRHYLLTSFHVNNQPDTLLPDETWLRARIPLFERYCLPSVLQQDTQDFEWMVFCDQSSPAWLTKYFADLAVGNLRLVRIRGPISGESVRSSIPPEGGGMRTITTRLDSDDALASDFIRRVQEVDSEAPRYAINFKYGLQDTRMGLLATRSLGSPFISISDFDSRNPQTVFDFDHQLVAIAMPVIQLAGSPGWLQSIHDLNVLNRAHGLPLVRRKWLAKFPLDVEGKRFHLIPYIQEVQPITRLARAVVKRVRAKF